MAKDNTIWIIAGLLIVGFLIYSQSSFDLFTITGGERMERDYPSIVDADDTVNVKYQVTGASGKWGATVIDSLSCPGESSNQERRFVMLSNDGNSVTIGYKIPNKEGIKCTFSGNYQFGNKQIRNFPTQTIETRVVTPQCSSGGDNNGDGIISRDELGESIQGWINGGISRSKLGSVIMEWSNGC